MSADGPGIKGGAFQLARKIFTSPVWSRDADTFRLFVWIVGNANFRDTEAESRGELMTSHSELAQALITYQRNTPLILSIKQIRDRLKWLVSEGMIKATPIQSQKRRKVRGSVGGSGTPKSQGVKSGGGVRIVVVNYDTYQTLDNYKVRGFGQGVRSGGKSVKGHPTQDKAPESLTKTDPKNVLKECIRKEEERTPSAVLPDLKKRYPDRDLIERTLAALRSTRKSGKIADSVLCNFLKSCAKYPIETVEGAFRTYLDKEYHKQGKTERYLLGIIRNFRIEDINPDLAIEIKYTVVDPVALEIAKRGNHAK